jgi:putative transposase
VVVDHIDQHREPARVQCNISGLTSPSYNTIRARVNAVDLKDLILHRVGPKAARDRFRPVSASSLRPERPLDLFQIDHTWMDIIVVDEVERAKRTPARLWLAPIAGPCFSASAWETLLERCGPAPAGR